MKYSGKTKRQRQRVNDDGSNKKSAQRHGTRIRCERVYLQELNVPHDGTANRVCKNRMTKLELKIFLRYILDLMDE